MTIIYFPFNSGTGALSYQDRWGKMAKVWRATGVLPDVSNRLETYGNSFGMLVKIKSGAAWIEGFYMENDAEVAMAIDASNGSNPRIDVVVARVNWTTNIASFAVLKGTAAVSPSAVALTQSATIWEIALAHVTVDALAVTIAAAKVADMRIISANPLSLAMVMAIS